MHLSDPTADAAWSLDLDEFPQPGWRQAVEDAWSNNVTRIRYNFIWNFVNGKPGISFYADKLHRRHGFAWRGIAHEWLALNSKEQENHVWTDALEVHHLQDKSKERFNRDMSLMERAVEELPNDPRLQHYYARQLLWAGQYVEASEWFQKHLDNPAAQWTHERSQSMIYLSQCGGNEAWKDMWLLRAAAECPERREVWFALADREKEKGNDMLYNAYIAKAESLPRDKYYLSSGR
jgi:predicted Zn-dependent protease